MKLSSLFTKTFFPSAMMVDDVLIGRLDHFLLDSHMHCPEQDLIDVAEDMDSNSSDGFSTKSATGMCFNLESR